MKIKNSLYNKTGGKLSVRGAIIDVEKDGTAEVDDSVAKVLLMMGWKEAQPAEKKPVEKVIVTKDRPKFLRGK
jgi:hypothetical protein